MSWKSVVRVWIKCRQRGSYSGIDSCTSLMDVLILFKLELWNKLDNYAYFGKVIKVKWSQ
jgi:hypothetical protein